jgi:uncharacterized membrane protein
MSRWLALAGLAALTTLMMRPPDVTGLLSATPLAALVLAGIFGLSRWAIATAIIMLPYFSYGIMEVLTNPESRLQAVFFSSLTVAVFLAALDSMRRTS